MSGQGFVPVSLVGVDQAALQKWLTEVARARDLVRNDGWGTGAVNRILDNTHRRPVPAYQQAGLYGVALCLAQVRRDMGGGVRGGGRRGLAHVRDDPAHHCDASRLQTMTQMFNLALRDTLIDGDGLGRFAVSARDGRAV